jgi:hypothetical protein
MHGQILVVLVGDLQHLPSTTRTCEPPRTQACVHSRSAITPDLQRPLHWRRRRSIFPVSLFRPEGKAQHSSA